MKHADGDDRGLHRVEGTGDDSLECQNDLRRQHDRIDSLVRPGAVGLHTPNRREEVIDRRVGGIGRHSDFAHGQAGRCMETENGFGLGIAKDTFSEHEIRAALFVRRRTFFGGLEDEHDGSGNLVRELGKNRRDAVLHRGVDVVAARMHHSNVLSVVGRTDRRFERKIGVFGDG
ncbi:MAG: hypothetical protein BMS9Abin37_1295 [Acidobacteriota bacterium]|nr:MAG: hypothetical protein BMS9Abin37_1295 [Acidobacteriota bacterium]